MCKEKRGKTAAPRAAQFKPRPCPALSGHTAASQHPDQAKPAQHESPRTRFRYRNCRRHHLEMISTTEQQAANATDRQSMRTSIEIHSNSVEIGRACTRDQRRQRRAIKCNRESRNIAQATQVWRCVRKAEIRFPPQRKRDGIDHRTTDTEVPQSPRGIFSQASGCKSLIVVADGYDCRRMCDRSRGRPAKPCKKQGKRSFSE